MDIQIRLGGKTKVDCFQPRSTVLFPRGSIPVHKPVRHFWQTIGRKRRKTHGLQILRNEAMCTAGTGIQRKCCIREFRSESMQSSAHDLGANGLRTTPQFSLDDHTAHLCKGKLVDALSMFFQSSIPRMTVRNRNLSVTHWTVVPWQENCFLRVG